MCVRSSFKLVLTERPFMSSPMTGKNLLSLRKNEEASMSTEALSLLQPLTGKERKERLV